MAPLTEEDRILIRILRAEKGYNAHQMTIEFPSRKWNKYALAYIDWLKKLMLRERLTAVTVVAGSTSRKVWWCRWLFQSLERRRHSLLLQRLRWTVFITAMKYSQEDCYVIFANCLELMFTSFSQQDGAPAHCSRHKVAYLNANVPELIEPENWPPNSLDLNRVDYSIWGCLQQLVYREPIRWTFERSDSLLLGWDNPSTVGFSHQSVVVWCWCSH